MDSDCSYGRSRSDAFGDDEGLAVRVLHELVGPLAHPPGEALRRGVDVQHRSHYEAIFLQPHPAQRKVLLKAPQRLLEVGIDGGALADLRPGDLTSHLIRDVAEVAERSREVALFDVDPRVLDLPAP